MPKEFEECVNNGGRVRTVKGKKYGCERGEYRKICFFDGESYLGHIHKKR